MRGSTNYGSNDSKMGVSSPAYVRDEVERSTFTGLQCLWMTLSHEGKVLERYKQKEKGAMSERGWESCLIFHFQVFGILYANLFTWSLCG